MGGDWVGVVHVVAVDTAPGRPVGGDWVGVVRVVAVDTAPGRPAGGDRIGVVRVVAVASIAMLCIFLRLNFSLISARDSCSASLSARRDCEK